MSDEDHDGCGVEEGFGGGEGRLRILPEASVAADPGKEPFDDPSARMHGKADLPGCLAHDFDGDDRGRRWPVAGIAGIGEGLGDEREGSAREAQHRNGSIAILHVGRLRIEHEGTPIRVDQCLALAAFDLLAGVVAARPPLSVVLTLWLSSTAADGEA